MTRSQVLAAVVATGCAGLVVLGSSSPECLTMTVRAEPVSNRNKPTDGVAAATPKYIPTYDQRGELVRPQNHHEWVFVGAPVTPNDMNDGKAAFPEFHNVYIDPPSFAAYKHTGRFQDGTVILKELVSVGSKSMDSGNGYFQGDFVSLEAMVKDRRRFTSEPGGWAFFRFGEAPGYRPTGARMKTESCNTCHALPTGTNGVDYLSAEAFGDIPVDDLILSPFIEFVLGETVSLQGDIDGDGSVGFPDFLILSANFGQAGTAAQGDIDGDGSIGFPDFLLLSGNFGQSAGAAAVPEPGTGCLALLGLLLLAGRRRRG